MRALRRPPAKVRWLFWEMDKRRLEVDKHAAFIIPRVLEFGGMEDVRWLVAEYGLDRIHAFLRDQGDIEISPKTLSFWRAVLSAQEEEWVNPSRRRSIALSRN